VKVADVFRRAIDRRIEEVVKVELEDEPTVRNELTEYVATSRIQAAFAQVLDPYQETIDNPTEDTNVWVSGFFGSGKSSFAKILGYLIANPIVAGKPACDWFFDNTTAPALKQLLTTQIHSRAKTITVFVDLLSSRNVVNEGESVVLPLYRALLDRLGYSTSVQLAEWEIRLEGDGRYDEFADRYEQLYGRKWADDHHDPTMKSEMSRVLHEMKPEEFPTADSFFRGHVEVDVSARSFADRALLLLRRRGGKATRVLFIADEAGQYVARDLKRVGDLNGLAEAFQARKNRLWLVATSQERLEDFVDSLEGSRTEIARLKDRFAQPLRVDLLPSDIEDVVAARVLEKSADGQAAVRSAFTATRNQLNANVKLAGSRGADLAEQQVLRLYPLLPYQVRLFIDAVTARREGGMVGGANRTLLRLAQQLVIAPGVGIGGEDVGRLATVDRAYDLMASIIPPRWRDEVEQVAAQRGVGALATRALKVIALCVDVRDLTLDAHNIAVLLHADMSAESMDADVGVALQSLVDEGRIELGTAGYRLQSPEGKTWIEARSAITPRLPDINRLRKELLKGPLGSLAVNVGRTFTVELTIGDEKLSKGDVPLVVVERGPANLDELVRESRTSTNSNRIWWSHTLSNATQQALEELHKSLEMINRRQASARTGADAELVAREKRLAEEWEKKARRGLAADLISGKVVFLGRVDDPPSDELKTVGQKIVEERIPEIYTRLGDFAAPLKASDPVLVLRDVSLDGVPASLISIGLVTVRPTGREIETTKGPLKLVLDEITKRHGYGEEVTGASLTSPSSFAGPPYGASLEVVQAIVAGAVRSGMLDVRYQGALIKNPGDQRLDPVFKGPAAFRSASFRPHEDAVPPERRVELAKRLTALIGTKVNATSEELARTTRDAFGADGVAADKVRATLVGLGLAIPNAVATVGDVVRDLYTGDDDGVVLTALAVWDDLIAGRATVDDLLRLVESHLDELRLAQDVAASSVTGLPDDLVDQHHELRDLLGAGDLAGKLGRITAITSAITDYRQTRLVELRTQMRQRLEHEEAMLRARYPGVDSDAMAETLSRLAQLVPDENDAATAELLEARLAVVDATSADVAHALDVIVAKDRLATVPIHEIAPELIRTPDELNIVVERLQKRVAELLGDDKEVRLA
jgi:hypothetical protein